MQTTHTTVNKASYFQFQELIYKHYREHGRSFPWRETRDPYHIIVSEVMLQQTQTYRVLPKYQQFLEIFPTVQALAAASLTEVLTHWQGLGYNRRGLMLQRAAQKIVSNFEGRLPRDTALLETLPGVGSYTAAAVAAFAFDLPTIVIETNIRAVYLHHFFKTEQKIHDREIVPFIKDTLDSNNPRHWYYALMDYGAFLKKTHPNPSRQSAHHTKQSRFEGSDRQIRGHIIRELTRGNSPLPSAIASHFHTEEIRVYQIITQLVHEELVCISPGGKLQLRDNI